MILDKIKLYKNKECASEVNVLEDFIEVQIFNNYKVRLPKEVSKDINEIEKYCCGDCVFDFECEENKKNILKRYSIMLDNDENVQKLNFESDNIIKYRRVSDNTEFCMVGFWEYDKECIIAHFKCSNDVSDKWETVFLQIFNSIKSLVEE